MLWCVAIDIFVNVETSLTSVRLNVSTDETKHSKPLWLFETEGPRGSIDKVMCARNVDRQVTDNRDRQMKIAEDWYIAEDG